MAATAVHVRSPGPARARRLPRVGDDRLVARVRAGDDAAFEIIYDRYYRGLLAFCGHMLGSRQEAEDALQHSFASAYRALRGSAGDIDLRPWLYTIARNRCLSALRAQRAQVSADGLAAEVGPFEGMSAQVQLRADLRELVDELQRLPDDQRAALVLFELGDESHAQIAAVLGVRREKVKALVFQAREALMRARDARATPCVEIREQLATDAGRVPRRSVARRHIDRCPGCADFEREVRRQRAAFAAILPLVPTVGLKASVLGFTLGGGGGGAVALGGAGAGGGATVAASGALAAGGVGGGGVAGSAGAAAAGAIGTAGAASVATGLATGSGAVGLASLPGKAVVAKILSVVALGGAGAQAQVHSHQPARPPAIHQPALRATEAVPAYPPSPRRHAPAAAPAAIQATRDGSPVTGPEASAAPPASSSSPAPAVSHAPAAPAPGAPSSSSPSASATPPAAAATAAPSEAPAATPAPATAAPSSAPAAGSSTTPSVTATTTSPTPAPVPAPAPAPAPSPITPPPATAPTEGTGTVTAGTAAPAADTSAASASAAAVAAS
jgi:RNA polymerase sigma factor (sigma-70 family)